MARRVLKMLMGQLALIFAAVLSIGRLCPGIGDVIYGQR